jgi:hypothetical protein
MAFDPSTAKVSAFNPATAQSTEVSAPQDTSAADKLTSVAGGVLDVARSSISGTGANIAGGLMGAATLGTNALGLTDDDPVAMIRQWQSKAYQPETEVGKKIAGTVSKLGEIFVGDPAKKLGKYTFQLTGSPLEATVAELMPDAISTIVGFQGPAFMKEAAMRGAGELAKKAVFNKAKDEAARTARQVHFSIAPTEYGNLGMRAVAGASGKAEVQLIHSERNAERVVDLAKINMEIPETAPLDRASYFAARTRAAQPYGEARGLGRMSIDAGFLADMFNAGKKFEQVASDFSTSDLAELDAAITRERGTYIVPSWDANSAVDMMSYLREQASDLLQSDKASDRKLGMVKRDMAAAFEDRIWRHANDNGKPELAARFQKARKQLAQIHVWEDSTNFNTGRISARQVVAQRAAVAGKVDPFSDELKIVADAAGAFPKSFQDVDVKGRSGPISVFERWALIGGVMSAATGASAGHAGLGLGGAAAVMGAAGSGAAGRALAGSRFATKRSPSYQPGMMGQVAMGMGEGAQAVGAVAGAETGNDDR